MMTWWQGYRVPQEAALVVPGANSRMGAYSVQEDFPEGQTLL